MRTIILSLLLSCHVASHAQEKPIVIPFELTKYNNLSVPVVLNKKDTLHLMFHTASSSVTLIEESVKKLSTLNFNGTDTVTSWGGSENTSRFSPGNTLQIGGLTIEQEPIWEDKYSGHFTDGKFGLGLFKDKVVEIDFDKKQIVLHNSLPPKVKSYTKLPAKFENNKLFVQATCNTGHDTVSNRFLIHSGYSGAVLFDDQFVADHKLNEHLQVTDTKEMKDAFGNALKTRKAVLPGFTVGKTTLLNIPVNFFEGAIGRQKMSFIGGDIIKRFNIIIDAKRTAVYLQPNKGRKSAYFS